MLGDSVEQNRQKILAREGGVDDSASGRAMEGKSGIEAKIRAAFPEEPEVAVAVSKAESGLNPNSINYSTMCIGLFQVRALPNRPSVEELKNPDINIQFARMLYDAAKKRTGNGWSTDWSAYTNKSYLRYL